MIRQLYFYLISKFKNEYTLSYNGEFGYELISVLPYAYWLHKQGKKVHTISGKDSKALYYFSDSHQESFDKRHYVIPKHVPVSNIHVRWLNTLLWRPPPLKEMYQNNRFIFDKPILILCNKYNTEWGNPPITFLSVEMLDKIMTHLSPKFQIIYCRPGSTEITDDGSQINDLKDHEFIRQNHPNVKLIQDLHKENKDLSFNMLQLMCFSNANHFITVQGGYSIFCSYFKGTNIVYGARSKKRTADEIVYKAYDRWYHKFSGSKVNYCDSYDKVITELKQL